MCSRLLLFRVCGICSCSLDVNNIGAAGAAAIGAALVHLPQLQTLGCVVCPAMCVRSWCALAREYWGMPCMQWHRLRLCCFMSGLCSCSLGYNRLGNAGAAAIGAGLVHLPQLQTLEYVVCSAVYAESWCASAPG